MITILLALFGVAAGAQTSMQDSWSAFPGDGSYAVNSEHTHDPMIFEFGARTFCLSTGGNGFGTLKSSTDLLTWSKPVPILAEHPAWLLKRVPEHRSIWAPDAFRVGNGLRLYYCASRWFGSNDSVIGYAENPKFDPDHPQKGWIDHGQVIESVKGKDFYNCIDPEVHVDQEGRHWLFFGSYFAGLYVVELDPSTGKIKESPRSYPQIVGRNTGSRENALEGSAVCFRNGYYYLFVSYGLAAQGVRSTYQIMVGRSKAPNGPFIDASGTSMVDGGHVNFLKTSPPMFSPGHCEVMQDRTGRWLMAYHFYDGRHYWTQDKWGLPRLQIREMIWSADGWPDPGLPVEYLATAKLSKHGSVVGQWVHQADFGEPANLTFRPDGTITGGKQLGRWSAESHHLILKWQKFGSWDDVWEDRLDLAYDGNYYVGRNKSGMVIRGCRVERKP